MKIRKCPHCGSTRITTSPSGEHLLCLGCQRILVQPRDKDAGKAAAEAREPDADSASQSVNQLRN
jgi:ribosomal protein S27E